MRKKCHPWTPYLIRGPGSSHDQGLEWGVVCFGQLIQAVQADTEIELNVVKERERQQYSKRKDFYFKYSVEG